VFHSTPAFASIPETPKSLYKPLESSEESDKETKPSVSSRAKLNEFLSSRDISPIRNQLKTAWNLTRGRTQRHYTRKARQVVHAVIEEIAPRDADNLWDALVTSRAVARQFPLNKEDHADSTLIDALTECYSNAGHWGTRRQIAQKSKNKKTNDLSP